MAAKPDPNSPGFIRLRGVRQNNLKGFDLDLPLGRYIAVTGLSGAGKSSLVFETLHAEGQRRYVETFSAYTRQFLDLLAKPRVDSIENIRPSIAIGQTNTVKTSRSTVGTMTELTDYFKVWFSHAATCFDPATGEAVESDDPRSIWKKASVANAGRTLVIAFRIEKPASLGWPEILGNLKGQGYTRVLLPGERILAARIDDLPAARGKLAVDGDAHLFVVQDRIAIRPEHAKRFMEAAETALHFGRGELRLFAEEEEAGEKRFHPAGHHSRGLHSPGSGRTFRPASPALFSFNSPIGACPTCRGFGRVIEIDTRLAIPDRSLSIDDGAIKCWEGEVYGESKKDLRVFARRQKIPTNVPFGDLTPGQQAYVIDGEPGYGEENGKTWPRHWYGIKGFFRWLEKNTYKMHVRVFLARYRTYNPCPACGGRRLQPEALCWKWRGLTLPDLYQMPSARLLALLTENGGRTGASRPADLAFDSILSRLRYLDEVGLGYLTLDRTSRTLSGGEVERVNLTSCLGTSLVDTLFVLDEPSVGLHSRDVDRLIRIIRSLTDAGNTVVVVEHDEAMIRAADCVVEVGPAPGAAGGRIVFQGSVPGMLASPDSITGAYFSGRLSVPVPASRRAVDGECDWLSFRDATKHNIAGLSFRIPLRRLVCLSGVSGSGKSTLLDNVIFQGLQARRRKLTDDPAAIGAIDGDGGLADVVLVDQSPLARTPRSNCALYTGAWELIRELFADTPEARAGGYTASSFSFNGGDGRCDHCQGLGSERIEMQFLSDVFVPCPVCEGRRFKPEVLALAWKGLSIANLLDASVSDALALFSEHKAIRSRLSSLEAVGLGYLTLGQPLNTLSGGEAQRLKLVRYLGGYSGAAETPGGALLLLDEPTTGMHRHDVKVLLGVLQALIERGHTVVVIEHNLDVLKEADWILEVGPGPGSEGGRIVAEGPPERIAAAGTATSPFLQDALGMRGEGMRRAAEDQSGWVSSVTPSGGIEVVGARENNLKNISLTIPHHALNVVTGISGSGKSTLAFDIIFAEGQRRFMESMSPYARQFVEQLPRPDLDRVSGIPPAVAIEQRVTRGSRKSTVATITEAAQYLRLLYARIGVQYHPDTGRPVVPLSPSALRRLLSRAIDSRPARRTKHLYLCAPLIRGRKGHHQPIATWIGRQGYEFMRADGRILRVGAFRKLDRYREHDIEVVVADFKSGAAPGRGKPGRDLPALLDEALALGKGTCFLARAEGDILSWFSTTRTDAETGESFPELDPKHFSFNSPRGWCPACRGHGRIFPWMLEPEDEDGDDPLARLRPYGIDEISDVSEAGRLCPECGGARLNRISRAVRLPFLGRGGQARGKAALSLPELLRLAPAQLCSHLRRLKLDARGRLIVQDILPQIEERLEFLDRVGLGYLSLDRPTETLSGGEAQRIRLAAQLGSNLSGVLYVLDEPSIGLHARDNARLIETLQALRAKGNTLLVVEHDEELMARADHIIDLGPGAGVNGGEVLAAGTPGEIRRSDRSLTGLFLSRGIHHPIRGSRRPVDPGSVPRWLELDGARYRNLRGFDLRLPVGRLAMVAGPSGAGKSTLFRDLLGPAASLAIRERKDRLSGAAFVRSGEFGGDEPLAGERPPLPFAELRGAGGFRSVITVDQSPIGKTPRSTPATYLGIFDSIRKFYALLPEARVRGYTASRFSFNTGGGRCPACEGAGRICYEMAFMPDTYLPCEACGGGRYGPELADLTWKGRNIGEVLRLSFEEAASFFDFHAQLGAVCRLMADCGLGYLTLGQSSPTLSGGEAQRLKLVSELSRGIGEMPDPRRPAPPRNLYLLEEPTIGLHMSDCEKLIRVLHSLVDQGHTVVVIEHNLDLLAEADYIVELGPAGGPGGGELIFQGRLEDLLKVRGSPTAPYLRSKMAPTRTRPGFRRAPSPRPGRPRSARQSRPA
ncbi:MAG: excinuclease ABC subunit UvrA [Opitutaceae bacterium]|jgi:excinuclease ABC subunit A